MLIRAGFEVAFEFTKAGAILLNAYVHPSRAPTICWLQPLTVKPQAEIWEYTDVYGNLCGRTHVPAGPVVFRTDALIQDDGLPDVQVYDALQHNVQDLPNEVLLFLLASGFTITLPPFSKNRIVPTAKSTSRSRTRASAARRAPR